MKNTFGSSVSVTLFGESHGPAVGAVLDGLAPGISVDEAYIADRLSKRKARGDLSTKRQEPDRVQIVSGVYRGKTTGTPLCMLILNEQAKSQDYGRTQDLLRPSHADFTASCKYHGFEDPRGGGHFSGRLTAPIVAAGAIAAFALEKKGICIGSHLKQCAGVEERSFSADPLPEIRALNAMDFAVLEAEKGEKMQQNIRAAAKQGDSVGGILETAVAGMISGVGEPFFDSVESCLAHGLFSVPAVKGVEFGTGFAFADQKGSQANDPFCLREGKIATETNHNGGINGGITNGMPLLFRCVIKPTPSVFLPQKTVNKATMTEETLRIAGRHDPAIVHRARVVVDSVTALVLMDLLAQRFGTDFFAGC